MRRAACCCQSDQEAVSLTHSTDLDEQIPSVGGRQDLYSAICICEPVHRNAIQNTGIREKCQLLDFVTPTFKNRPKTLIDVIDDRLGKLVPVTSGHTSPKMAAIDHRFSDFSSLSF